MERRVYTRIKVGADGAIFLQESEKSICEFAGIVDNVCEGGLGIILKNSDGNPDYNFLDIGQKISFHAYDNNGFNIEEAEGAFYGSAKIVRKSVVPDGLYLGCEIDLRSDDFQDYVKGKKVYLYVKSLKSKIQ